MPRHCIAIGMTHEPKYQPKQVIGPHQKHHTRPHPARVCCAFQPIRPSRYRAYIERQHMDNLFETLRLLISPPLSSRATTPHVLAW